MEYNVGKRGDDIYFGIVMFTLMKILYLMLSVRISEILSDKKCG